MKTYIKKETKKYPYNRMKHSIFTQIRDIERRKHGEVDRYAIIDSKGKVIEKYRIRQTAENEMIKLRKDYYEELIIVELDENGKPVTTKIK